MTGGQIGTSAYDLSVEEVTEIKNEMQIRYADPNVFSEVFGTRPIDPGTLVRRINMINEMAGAHIVRESAMFPVAQLDRTPVDVYVDKLGLAIDFSMEEIDAARSAGIPLWEMNTLEQARQVRVLSESNLANAIRLIANANSRTGKAVTLSDSAKAWTASGSTPYNDVSKVVDTLFEQVHKKPNVALYGNGVGNLLDRKDAIDGHTLGSDMYNSFELAPIRCPSLNAGEIMFAYSPDIVIEEANPFSIDGPHWEYQAQKYRSICWVRNNPYIETWRSVYFLDVTSTS